MKPSVYTLLSTFSSFYRFTALTRRQIIIGILFLGALTGLSGLYRRAQASGTITGTVYVDYNMNGVNNTSGASPNLAIDSGVSGVTVTAYDSSGTQRGTATTSAAGAYSLSATGTGPYRLEFTTLPSGYYPSAVGTNNATTVRFVPDGASSGIDLGITRPDDYSQNNPLVVIPQYLVGNVSGASLVGFPYIYSNDTDGNIDSTGITGSPTRTATLGPLALGDNSNIGAVYGLAWERFARRIYSGAYIKRGAKLGALSSESTGAIYVKTETGSPTLYVDLNTVFGAGTAGTNPHPVSSNPDWYAGDTAARDVVGKAGLGDLEISADGTQLYAVNFADRRLYVIPTGGALNSTTITRFDIPTSGLATSSGNCAAADVRPFALGRDASGQMYVGAVCSAESTANAAQLHAYVWQFVSNSFVLVANNALTFTRVVQAGSPATTRTWMPWSNTDGFIDRPAPMLADIDFNNGVMILGIRDRYGDQAITLVPDSFNRGYGDIMRACPSGATWVFESNGTCGGVTTGGAGSGSGNGGGEFYIDLNGDGREEGLNGGVLQVPGYNHTLTTAYDPVLYNSAGTRISNFYTGGVQRYHNTTGVHTGAYDVYLDADPDTFGKANGVGDIEALPDSAPLQIGNRIWTDTDGDGVQDPGENGIANVALQLWADTNADGTVDTQVGTATANANGEYYFGGANSTNLSANSSCTGSVTARVGVDSDDAEQSGTTMSLSGSPLSLARISGGGGSDNIVGLRFNRLNVPKGANITSATLTFTADGTPGSGTTNVTIAGEAADNAVTYTTAASNISSRTATTATVAWSAIGTWTAGATTNAVSPGVASIVQEVINRAGWETGNAIAFRLTNNATTGTNRRQAEDFESVPASAPLLTVAYQCPYTINPNTRYEVRLPSANFNSGQPLNGLALTRLNSDASANGDSRDADATYSGGLAKISLTTGTYGQNDHTSDFGLKTSTVSLGNRVFLDNGGGTAANANNGLFDTGESGISGVTVELYDSAGTTLLGTATTDSTGYYSFPGLVSGTSYHVRLAAANFNTGGPLANYGSSTGSASAFEGLLTPDANLVVSADAADKGTTTGTLGSGGYIQTRVAVAVTTGSGPTGEENGAGDVNPDTSQNLKVDFGLITYSAGNRVWRDNGTGVGGVANDGILNGTEAGLAGVSVSLFQDADSNGVADGAALATLTTDSTGYYRFDTVKPAKYVICVNAASFGSGQPLNGLTSTTTVATTASNTTDSRDNGVDNFNPPANGICSGTFDSAAKSKPTGETNPGSYGAGATSGAAAADNADDLTVDFAFNSGYSLGNRVWRDDGTGAGGIANDGIRNGTEPGIANVSLSLFADATCDSVIDTPASPLATLTTDSSGYYRFDGLKPACYIVRVNPGNFNTGQPLVNLSSSGTTVNAGSNTVDSRDNGVDNAAPSTNGISTTAINLASKTIPGSETDNQTPGSYGSGAANGSEMANAFTDLTIDLGFRPGAPSAVTLSRFEALTDGQAVLLQWHSGEETDNLGYHLLRRDSNGAVQRLTAEPVAGSAFKVSGGTTLPAGDAYYWHDAFRPGAQYYLEALDLKGAKQTFGPISPRADAKAAQRFAAAPNARLLSQLNEARTTTLEAPVLPKALRQAARAGLSGDAWAQQLRLAAGPAVQLGVRQTGWYRVSGAQLQAAGLSPDHDANYLHLYADGVQVPLNVRTARGGTEGPLGAAGVLEFYGLAQDTRESETRVYWLAAGTQPGLRFGAPVRVAPRGGGDAEGEAPAANNQPPVANSKNASAPSAPVPSTDASFAYTVERKDRSVYFSGLSNGEENGNFFGAVIARAGVSQTLSVAHLDPGASAPARVEVAFQGATENTHRVRVQLNGQELGFLEFSGKTLHTQRFNLPQSALQEGPNTLQLAATQDGDVSVVDYARLTYARRYVAANNQLLFTTGARQMLQVSGFTTPQVRVFDLTTPQRAFQLEARAADDPSGYAVRVTGPLHGRTLLAVADDQALTPSFIQANEPSSWHGTDNTADFLIITPREFRPAAQTLAAGRQAAGLATQVVHIEDVYDETTGGTPGVAGLRSFLRFASEKWSGGPRYVLLLGDANVDARRYLNPNARDYVPTGYVGTAYIEAMSDESLVDFNGDAVGELSVGRLPARSLAQAQAVVAKVLSYQPRGLAGGVLQVNDSDAGQDFAGTNQLLAGELPAGTSVTTLSRGTQPDTQLRTAVLAGLSAGPAVVTYAGHGAVTSWASAGLLQGADAPGLGNNQGLSVYLTLTCLTGYFAGYEGESLSEALINAPHGAVAVWASSGLTVAAGQQPVGREMVRQLYGAQGSPVRLGDAARLAKATTEDIAVRQTWILFGDPTMQVR